MPPPPPPPGSAHAHPLGGGSVVVGPLLAHTS